MTISIIITLIACLARRWLIQQSLQFYRLRTSTMLVLIGLSMIWVASIISFPHLYTRYTSQARTIESLTTSSALSYLWYIGIVGLIITLIVFYRSSSQISQHQAIIVILLAAIGVGFPQLGRYPLYYYFIAAGVEEYVKYYIWLGSFKLYGTTSSDIILFGMLSGLGFACIENMVYLVSMIHNPDMVTANILRRVVGPIVHMIYSGGLAYGYRYLYRRGWGIRWVIISMICITIIHMWYNSWIGQGWRWYIIAIIVLGYGIISWMTYQCDRLYFEAKNNLKTTT
jgi:RsiW-degrading membrane proteinase PrsW (M82 family)